MSPNTEKPPNTPFISLPLVSGSKPEAQDVQLPPGAPRVVQGSCHAFWSYGTDAGAQSHRLEGHQSLQDADIYIYIHTHTDAAPKISLSDEMLPLWQQEKIKSEEGSSSPLWHVQDVFDK